MLCNSLGCSIKRTLIQSRFWTDWNSNIETTFVTLSIFVEQGLCRRHRTGLSEFSQEKNPIPTKGRGSRLYLGWHEEFLVPRSSRSRTFFHSSIPRGIDSITPRILDSSPKFLEDLENWLP